jgi:hypothetical protein
MESCVEGHPLEIVSLFLSRRDIDINLQNKVFFPVVICHRFAFFLFVFFLYPEWLDCIAFK